MIQQSNRICRIIGHESNLCQQICVYRNCINFSRWVCQFCIREDRHLHGKNDYTHIINFSDFKQFLTIQSKETQQQIEEDEKKLQNFNTLIQQVITFFQTLQEYKKQSQQYFENLKQQQQQQLNIIKNPIQDLGKLSEIELRSLISFQPRLYQIQQKSSLEQQQYSLINDLKDKLILYLEQTQLQIAKQQKDVQNDKQKIQDKFVDYFQFQNQHFEDNYDFLIHSSVISDNGEYFVYSSGKLIITFLDVKKKTILKMETILDIVLTSMFSQTNQFLICGCQTGKLIGFDMEKKMKKYLKMRLCRSAIQQIVNLDQNHMIIITEKSDTFYIIDILQQTEKNRINLQQQIRYLDYDQFNNCVIACTNQNSMVVYSLELDKIFFDQQNSHDIQVVQLQIISKQNILISLGQNGELKKWKLDYHLRQFIEINLLQEYKAFSISIINQLQKIVLICELQILLLDFDLRVVQKIQHDISDIKQGYVQQNNSLSFLNIRGKRQLRLMKNQN